MTSPLFVDLYGIRERRPGDIDPPKPTAEDRAEAERRWAAFCPNASPQWRADRRQGFIENEAKMVCFERRQREHRARCPMRAIAAFARDTALIGSVRRERRAA